MKAIASLIIISAISVCVFGETPAVPSRGEIKTAASYILSCDCGNSVGDPGYAEKAKILKDAGAAIVPVLTELVGDKSLSTWFVANAARSASQYPLSTDFRTALRTRRDDRQFDHDPGALLGVFEYFAISGDASDLKWMESAINRMDESRKYFAARPMKKLRERLAPKN
jgi:hypothetical protein